VVTIEIQNKEALN